MAVFRCAHQATRAGDQLLAEGIGCPRCSPELLGEGAVAMDILRMVDIHIARGMESDCLSERSKYARGTSHLVVISIRPP